MDKFKSILKPKPNPQEQLRDWQRRLRQECRNIERQIRGMLFYFLFFVIVFLFFWVGVHIGDVNCDSVSWVLEELIDLGLSDLACLLMNCG
jgi:apolipoprotein N-acyltransferase